MEIMRIVCNPWSGGGRARREEERKKYRKNVRLRCKRLNQLYDSSDICQTQARLLQSLKWWWEGTERWREEEVQKERKIEVQATKPPRKNNRSCQGTKGDVSQAHRLKNLICLTFVRPKQDCYNPWSGGGRARRDEERKLAVKCITDIHNNFRR